jgi:hypothetical protein
MIGRVVRCVPLLVGLVLLVLGGSCTATTLFRAPGPVAFLITAHPIERFRIGDDTSTFGCLEFRGGLELSGDSPDFGGVSGLVVAADGQDFVAVSDAGLWLTGRFVEKDGRLSGVENAAIGPILGPGGKPFAAMGRRDTESLGLVNGNAYIGIEGMNEIWSFPYGQDGMLARGSKVPAPSGILRLPANRGLEALTLSPIGSPLAGAIVAISERSGAEDAPTKGFIVGGPMAGEFLLNRTPPYDITDIAFLPGGDLLVLERRASFAGGFGKRLRRIAGASILPGAVLDGPVLLEAGPTSQIDNMEALSVSSNAKGETIITLMSDDNYSYFKRSLVLRFALVP